MFKRLNIPERSVFILLFLVCLSIYFLGILKVKSFFWGDSLYYYAYTRSIVIDHDIDFANEAFHPLLGFPNPAEISRNTGKITNKFSPGTALFWIPGLVVGQGVSWLGNMVSGSELFVLNGSGVLSQFFVGVSAVLFSILGLWLVNKTLLEFVSKKVASLSVVLLFLTTQVFYYTTMDPLNSHSISFLLSAILLYQLTKILQSDTTWQKVLPMGIVAGFLVLVRNQDVVVILPILLALILVKKEPLLHKINWFTLFSGSAFCVFSVQLYTTVSLFGVLGSPYLIRGEKLSWFQPDFYRVLFTLENGLFFFAPVLFFAVGMLIQYLVSNIQKTKKHEDSLVPVLAFVALATFFLQLYVVACWGPEIIGGPYGSRMFVSVLPHLSIGVALLLQSLVEKLRAKQFMVFFITISTVLFINMLVQTLWMLYRF